MRQCFARCLTIPLIVTLSGCASIVSKSTWPVTIQTKPNSAKCIVSKSDGTQIQVGETPFTVPLDSGNGFFQRASYAVSCEKSGYMPSKQEFTSSVNGWYFGNILFGGIIGILIVDPATGAMFRLDDTKAVTLYADNSDGRTQQSEDLNKEGYEKLKNSEYASAIPYFEKAIEISPKSVKPINYKGLCHLKLKDYDKALQCFEKAIEIEPGFSEIYKFRGDLYVEQGKDNKALDDYNKALNIKPSYNEALVSRGRLYMSQGKTESAKADITLACKQGYAAACNFQF